MSDRATTWAWQQRPTSVGARLTLLLIANNADDEGCFEVRRADFAEILDCSVDTFDRRVRGLIDEGLLSVRAVMSKRGQRPNVYVLAIPKDFARDFKGRRIAAAKPETNEENAGAAELRLAATVAAPIKSLTKLNTERVEASFLSEPKKKTRFNPRWARVSDNFRAFAMSKGLINGSVDEMFENFRDYHLAKGSEFVDWAAAWRNWVNRAIKFQAEKEANAKPARNDPNENRRKRHRAIAKVLEARKMARELDDGGLLQLGPPKH